MSRDVNEAGELSEVTDAMSYEGHTPGPWAAGTNRMDGAHVLAESGDRIICYCHSRLGDDFSMTRANSRLIAAAPDLLAENKRLRAALQSIVDDYDYTQRAGQHGDRSGAYAETAKYTLEKVSQQTSSR